jgi:hypothetical protein
MASPGALGALPALGVLRDSKLGATAMKSQLQTVWFGMVFALLPAAAWAEPASSLRLVPMPKEVRSQAGLCSLTGPLVVQIHAPQAASLGIQLAAELKLAGLPAPRVASHSEPAHALRLGRQTDRPWPSPSFRKQAGTEDYWLSVEPQAITVVGHDAAGLFYGLQTLRQLIRANCRDGGLPCLVIRDWPALRWRSFMDDMTRGPSATLATLQREAALGAELKMNLFTYYMEYQYAFKKHPEIGPPDGSLEPDDLRRLVAFARPLAMDVLGNQQSFGHFGRILAHEKYAALRESPDVLTPVNPDSYRLLDDLYSEVVPLLPFPMFNVCCDETWGLGTGPSKTLAEKIGVGGVYAEHLGRVHDLLAKKYGKRMMMWGDIILQHPEHLAAIPKDTVMLTWGYGPRDSFENQILPFARSGYEFFVCPGVNNWSRVLPDFSAAATNIRNFVRDGVRHGALGMLNTEWKDDGETLRGPSWHGYAWGAECAWTGSTTEPDDFNRRIGAVLFGESGDHFGQAIALLGQTHRLAGTDGMLNRRFWEAPFLSERSPATLHATATRLLELVRPAIEHLQACRQEARLNADLLDAFLLGARRMQRIAQRDLDALEASRLYVEAWQQPIDRAGPRLEKIVALVGRNRQAMTEFGREFARLWGRESKPYALDWTLKRYQTADAWYATFLARLESLRTGLQAGHRLPAPEDLGLAPGGHNVRRTRPHAIVDQPLAADAPWEASATHRLALVVDPGPTERWELPVEVDVAVPTNLIGRPVRAFCTVGQQAGREVLAQLDPLPDAGTGRLTLLLPGPLPKRTPATVRVYLGLAAPPARLPDAASTRDAPHGMKWIENDKIRCLLGPEGAHLYRWEIKALANRDLTMPGEKGWAGFSDIGANRSEPHKLVCTAGGPALVRYECREPSGLVKTISLFGGTSWVEVVLSDPVNRYWDFDNPKNFAADGPTPGRYLFSSGATGPVPRQADGVAGQVKANGALWGIKWSPDRLALGMATPDAPAQHVIAPGSGAGGVGIEGGRSAAGHFVTFGGQLPTEPRETMERLRQSLGFRTPPKITVHRLEAQ